MEGDVDVEIAMVGVVERDGTEAVDGSHSTEGASNEATPLAVYSEAAGGQITEPMGRGTTEIVDAGM